MEVRGGIAAVALISILLTDLDKIVVSELLPLKISAYSFAGRVAASLTFASSPVFSALLPLLRASLRHRTRPGLPSFIIEAPN